SDASVLSQFTRASAAITNATGIVPSCYRPPYGSVNARVHSLAVEAGLPNAGWTAGSSNTHWGLWDIDTRDWELDYNQTWYQLSRVSAGDVVLMHSVKSFSADIFAEWMAQNAQRFDFQPLPGCGTEPPTPTTRPTLRLGSTGPAVSQLEQRLTELGYNPGTIDTNFDATTRNAVIAFQTSAAIARDGIVGPITWSKLDTATPGP
ncbi:MAG: peptidoglycan-binding protein, partial [Acidimicrobiales bacterium]